MNGQDLPIWAVMPQVLAPLRERRNVVVVAPTGSGKTTQVPQAIVDSGISGNKVVLVVEPRRVACRAAARYVAQQRATTLGVGVGYIIRYDNQSSLDTEICFVTDGVLMRFLEQDASLTGVGVVIFDEFHERRVFSDLALALVKAAQKRRSDLRIAAMSATMATERVAAYLDASVVASEGKSFEVEVKHVAQAPSAKGLAAAVATQVVELHCSKAEGDILVFLPGKGEITAVEREFRRQQHRRHFKNVSVVRLHAELPAAEQDHAFAPASGRKVILSTNVAETSVTIPGVRMVVDTGLERRYSFDQSFGVDTLRLYRISQASATQRAGRAGREAPGKCIRLWSADEHGACEIATKPEIHRLDLASVVLSLKAVGVKDPVSFDFLEPPPAEHLATAQRTLKMLGALDEKSELTKTGWLMVRLPLPPRYGRMMVEAERSECIPEVATITAMLAGREVFLSLPGRERIVTGRHRALAIDDSCDLFTFLELYRQMHAHKGDLDAWCETNFLSAMALLEAKKLRWRIVGIALRRGSKWKKPEWQMAKKPHERDAIRRQAVRRAIASGLVDRLGRRVSPGVYELATGITVELDKASVVDSEYIVVGEVYTAGAHGPNSIASLVTAVGLPMMEQLAPTLFRSEQVVVERFPVTKTARVRRERRYLNLVLEQEEGLVPEDGQSGSLTERLSPLSAVVSRIAGKSK